LEGSVLTARLDGDKVVLIDEKGSKATVVVADLAASNGVIHVTDAVSLPN
ncbi:MAG: fasciclin domain-containing protein, partial [Sphingobacteriales bacterium]